MLLAFVAVLLATGVTIFIRRRVPWSIDTDQLGTVSQQWLAEYRASHPS